MSIIKQIIILKPILVRSKPGHKLYWGAWIVNEAGQAPWDVPALSLFEQQAGKSVSLVNWGSPFYNTSYCGNDNYCPFQTAQFDIVREHGSIPFFSWANTPAVDTFSDAAVASGAQDNYITKWAQAAKTWGHPFFLRFAWEMNGDWFPWQMKTNTPSEYVAMWRHVHDIFTNVGADNVTWVWCPNIDPHDQYVSLQQLYPGDTYVDWTCLDGYNGGAPWRSFKQLFDRSYQQVVQLAPDKPMVIAETASTEHNGFKAQWIGEALNMMTHDYSKIYAFMWFQKEDLGPGNQTDWPFTSSLTATQAFAAAIQDPLFQPAQYQHLDSSPIPVP